MADMTYGQRGLRGIKTLEGILDMSKEELLAWSKDVKDPYECIKDLDAIQHCTQALIILLAVEQQSRIQEATDATVAEG